MPTAPPIGKSFPNLRARIASYDPATQIVSFETMTAARYDDVIKNPVSPENAEDYSIIVHELRHNIDHFGTLWGQKHLLKLQKALVARAGTKPEEFYNIIPYKKHENQLFHNDYYSEHYQQTKFTGFDKRWRYKPTVGLRFDSEGHLDENNPILFAVFHTADDSPLVRAPITVAALLEANSMREELFVRVELFKKIYPDEWQFHLKMYGNELFSGLIYNQNLVLYSVAVHTAAQILDIPDLITVFGVTSAIATLALNMPDELAATLPIIGETDDENSKRARALLHKNDPGYVFYTLCNNYAKTFKSRNGKYSLDELLSQNKMPKRKQLEKIINEEFKAIAKNFTEVGMFTKRFASYNEAGQRILALGGVDGGSAQLPQKVKASGCMPPVAFIDGGIEVYKDVLNNYNLTDEEIADPSLWYNVVKELDMKMQEFYTVRGL